MNTTANTVWTVCALPLDFDSTPVVESAVAAVIAVAASTMLAVYANVFAFARVDSRIAMIATRGIGLMTTPVASGMSCAVIDSISATVQAANPAIGETFGLHDIATHGVTEARL